ncbi:MAG: hypothetical protein JW829_09150 [Pirellulales bacterium]|nr:hypothetical protein [Pirellulales bacterium]
MAWRVSERPAYTWLRLRRVGDLVEEAASDVDDFDTTVDKFDTASYEFNTLGLTVVVRRLYLFASHSAGKGACWKL